ncbi:uncharacterized protein LOC126793444 isoform X2 [Argentina anserina]|uniref:uncharacterized protein LOC126793444 isoform X1 n=1 Tax=Argentina anserina TaxID=57926 RepID=UPI00217647FD|nr:uncharacterized protein LOC126793444 isoform X1 [Potentilla anserina]XP_050375937.1 uncharacterized protein LOC126793444 isoform X2 [Potentilla anserina]
MAPPSAHTSVISEDACDGALYSFINRGRVARYIPEDVFQYHTRDLLNRVLDRWENDLPCGSLDLEYVLLEDNSLVIPKLGTGVEEDQDYVEKFRRFAVALFGGEGRWPERDDFIAKLGISQLKITQFCALYFHPLLQNRVQQVLFLADFVERYKWQNVVYNGRRMPWECAFNHFDTQEYAKENGGAKECIDLELICKRNEFVFKVYKYKVYNNRCPATKLKLIRNIIRHINDYRQVKCVKQGVERRVRLPKYTHYEIGALIEDLFPGTLLRLFNFLWKLEADLDFRHERLHFKEVLKGST